MNDIVFSPQAFKDYLEWLTVDKLIMKTVWSIQVMKSIIYISEI